MSEDPEPATPRTLADRLAAARRSRFVGRADELALFERLLSGDHPAGVLFVHGPGGIGKSTLLREFARRAEARRRVVVELDARNLAATPQGIRAAFAQALGLDAAAPPGLVLLIDTFELIASLELWLRDEWLPELPADVVVVLAGRIPADLQWRADPGWAELAVVAPLAPLSAAESAELLRLRHAPDASIERAAALAHGHPLALGLLADALRGGRLGVLDSPAERRGLVRALVEHSSAELSDPLQREAFNVLVLARMVTEPMLAEVVDVARAAALFEMLRRLAFVESGEQGLFIHDLAREAFEAEWAARRPDDAERVRLAIIKHLTRAMQRMGAAERPRFYRDWMFLLRHTATAPYIDARLFEDHFVDALAAGEAREADVAALESLARRIVGPTGAALLRRYAGRRGVDTIVLRRRGGALVGGALILRWSAVGAEDERLDPVLHRIGRFLRGRAPLPAGREVEVMRFVLDRSDVLPNATSTFGGGVLLERAMDDPMRSWSFNVHHNVDDMEPLYRSLTRLNWHHRMPELDTTADGRNFGVFGRDYLAEPWAWFAEDAEPPRGQARPLSRDEFAAALRDAMRHHARLDRLGSNALLGCALLRGAADPLRGLRGLLGEAVNALAEHPADLKFHHALRLTWIDPGMTQEKVAEELGLPFNTYRYHLSRGLERVVQMLWQRELQAAAGAQPPV